MGENIKICKSIMKKNKSFTIGLLIMSILTIALGFLGFNIGQTSKGAFTDFLNFTNLPDVLCTTEIIPTQTVDSFKTQTGIKSIESRVVYESNFELNDEKVFPTRVFTYNPNGSYRLSFFDEYNGDTDLAKIYTPFQFSTQYGIECGDQIQVNSPFGPINAIVKGIVSTFESFSPTKDFMSKDEEYSYCYIYIDEKDFNKKLDTTKFSNQFFFYFTDNISPSLKNDIFQKIDGIFGDKLINKQTFENAEETLCKSTDLDNLDRLAKFFSILVLIITLCFNCIFIQIIVKKESSTIGLLRALGYSKSKTIGLFCLFTVLINLFATFLGLPLGFGLLKFASFSMSSNQGIPYLSASISPLFTTLIIALSFLCGLSSAIFCTSTISKIDPSEAYGNQVGLNPNPVKHMSTFKTNEFFKISITSILRNLRRQIIAALSVTACIAFIYSGLAGFGSINNITESVYGKRYLYDISIWNINEEGCEKILSGVEGIEILEKTINFEAEFNDRNLIINALEDNYQLIKLYDKNDTLIKVKNGIVIDEITANKNSLKAGDIININGYDLQIDGIAREITNPVSYISIETANEMGKYAINGVMIKVTDSSKIDKIAKNIFNIDESFYLVRTSDQDAFLTTANITIKICLAILSLLALLIGILLISNMSFIDFLEMQNKYAILRAIGYTPKKLTKINLIQNLSRLVAGAIFALPLSFGLGNLFELVLTTDKVQFIFGGFFSFYLMSVAASFIFVVIGVVISYYNIKKMNLVNHLNNNE